MNTSTTPNVSDTSNISKTALVRMAKEHGIKPSTTLNKSHLLRALGIDLPPSTDERAIRCANLKLVNNSCPLTFISESGDRRSFVSMSAAMKGMRFGSEMIVRMRDEGITHKGWTVGVVGQRCVPRVMTMRADSPAVTCVAGQHILERIRRDKQATSTELSHSPPLHNLAAYFLHRTKVWLIRQCLEGGDRPVVEVMGNVSDEVEDICIIDRPICDHWGGSEMGTMISELRSNVMEYLRDGGKPYDPNESSDVKRLWVAMDTAFGRASQSIGM